MSKYYFDEETANKAVQFIETHLTHTKGELAKTPFILHYLNACVRKLKT